MYYLFDTCTTRCSINGRTRPRGRSHLRIVPIGSDNTRTKCNKARPRSEIASNFSLSPGRERLENRGAKSVSKRRDTLLLLSTPHNARPSFAGHPPRGGFFSAQPIITHAVFVRSVNATRCKPCESVRFRRSKTRPPRPDFTPISHDPCLASNDCSAINNIYKRKEYYQG